MEVELDGIVGVVTEIDGVGVGHGEVAKKGAGLGVTRLAQLDAIHDGQRGPLEKGLERELAHTGPEVDQCRGAPCVQMVVVEDFCDAGRQNLAKEERGSAGHGLALVGDRLDVAGMAPAAAPQRPLNFRRTCARDRIRQSRRRTPQKSHPPRVHHTTFGPLSHQQGTLRQNGRTSSFPTFAPSQQPKLPHRPPLHQSVAAANVVVAADVVVGRPTFLGSCGLYGAGFRCRRRARTTIQRLLSDHCHQIVSFQFEGFDGRSRL